MTPDELAQLLVQRDPSRLDAALAGVAPDSAAGMALRGELLRRKGNAAAAAALLESALERLPGAVALRHAAALARAILGDRAAARAHWEALLAHTPDDAMARFQIGVSWHDDNRLAEAVHWYEAQLARTPALAGVWLNLGAAHFELGDIDAALAAWQRAHLAAPDDVRPLSRAAAALGERAALPEAIERLSRAIAIEPASATLRFARAAHRSSLALHGEAVADLREAVALEPQNAAGHSALLLELHYDDTLATRAELFAAHDEWAARHATHAAAACQPPPARARLRIGYLSPRFGDVPLAALLLPVLEAQDRSRFEIVAYAAHPAQGESAARMQQAVDHWRDLPSDDAVAARMIAEDAPDLLVDLAGHAPGNRMPLLARRPARVQATWLDWFDTTGVAAIDYLIGDATHTPPVDAGWFRERLVLLPGARFAYRPPVAIATTPAPARARGQLTFGSFNRHAKLTDEVIDLWAALLGAVPHARLELRASAYRAPSTVALVRRRWAARDVPIERIDFEPFVSLDAMHAAYAGIDIALDPFPFNGGVTTCDALAHGVPVVTLEGERMIARQGAALLRAAGRSEWIATSRDDYVRIAVGLADSARIDEVRELLVHEFARSPLCDVDGFTRTLERAFVAMIESGPGPGPPLVVEDGRIMAVVLPRRPSA